MKRSGKQCTNFQLKLKEHKTMCNLKGCKKMKNNITICLGIYVGICYMLMQITSVETDPQNSGTTAKLV